LQDKREGIKKACRIKEEVINPLQDNKREYYWPLAGYKCFIIEHRCLIVSTESLRAVRLYVESDDEASNSDSDHCVVVTEA